MRFINAHSRVDIDNDFVVVQMEEAIDEERPLQARRGHQEVDPDGGKSILLQESHQESETDENHDVYILEHWEAEGRVISMCINIDGQYASWC